MSGAMDGAESILLCVLCFCCRVPSGRSFLVGGVVTALASLASAVLLMTLPPLEGGAEFDVELASGEVVGDGPVVVGVVGHPDEGDDIVVVEEVEDLHGDGEVVEQLADAGAADALEAGELDGVAPVGAEVGREVVVFNRTVVLVGMGGGSAGAEDDAEVHAPPGECGEVVLQEYFALQLLTLIYYLIYLLYLLGA